MAHYEIEKIFVDERAEKDWVCQAVMKGLPSVPVEIVYDKKKLIKEYLARKDPLGEGKKILYLTRFYGKRLKPCPGTSQHICCGYYVINAVTNCPMDCSYCVLQGYLNNPFLTLYSNWEDLIQEVEAFLSAYPRPFPRVGTGELSDSLALDTVFPVSEFLVPFFARRRDGVLELKTKSGTVENLLRLDHRERTIVSWSLNPEAVIRHEERRTASLEERISRAYEVQMAGYPVGFHFDPLIHYPGWETAYRETVERLFRRIDPRRVAWISLGGFRYPRELKGIATERFPKTRVFLGELFPGRDGKFRYLREMRIEMYRKMAGWLREVDPGLFVYLCMESPEVWEEVFGRAPAGNQHLNHLFEEQLGRLLGH